MKLTRPLVVLDLETTGTWIDKDKIIEIAMVKTFPDGKVETYRSLVNPEIPIPRVVRDLTGISGADVAEAPKFKAIVQDVLAFIGDSDLGGFNAERFDIPLLNREVQDAGLKFTLDKRRVYDAQKVFHLNEKRDLNAAYRYYCQKDLGASAHSALADATATLEILVSQVGRYGAGDDRLDVLDRFDYDARNEFYDDGRRFRWWNGKLYMMFGKYARKDSLREVAKMDRPYLEWILTQNFSEEIKQLVRGALEGKFPTNEKNPSKV